MVQKDFIRNVIKRKFFKFYISASKNKIYVKSSLIVGLILHDKLNF